jgi:hypothetical protein
MWLASTALLCACRIHGNVEMGEHVAKWVLELEFENAACYVLLSAPIYAAAGSRCLCENFEQERRGKRCEETASLHLE